MQCDQVVQGLLAGEALTFGLPWLVATNPRLDWAKRTLSVKHKGRWIPLPTVALEKVFAGPF